MEIHLERRFAKSFVLMQLVLHSGGLVYFSAALILHSQYSLQSPVEFDRYAIGFKFLGIWTVTLHIFYCFICLLTEMFALFHIRHEPPEMLFRLKCYIEVSLCFPLALFSTSAYWFLTVVAKKLQFSDTKKIFPLWLRHFCFTGISVYQVLETITSSRECPSSIASLISLTTLYGFYLVFVGIIYHITGQWVYAIIGSLKFAGKIILFLVVYLLICLWYFVGKCINYILWDDEKGYQICPFIVPPPRDSHKMQSIAPDDKRYLRLLSRGRSLIAGPERPNKAKGKKKLFKSSSKPSEEAKPESSPITLDPPTENPQDDTKRQFKVLW